MEISNKTLTILLIGTMLVSVFGTLVSLSRIEGIQNLLSLTGAFGGPGAATWGATNITIQSSLEINFSDDELNFSSGRVAAGGVGCQIGSEGQNTTGCQGFRVPKGGLILENTGNVNVKLNLTNLNYSVSFFNDQLAGYAIKIQTPESAGVTGEFNNLTCLVTTSHNLSDTNAGTGSNFTGFAYVNLTRANYPGNTSFGGTAGKVLCTMFNASDTNDILNISVVMFITPTTPATPTGGAADLWTATGYT